MRLLSFLALYHLICQNAVAASASLHPHADSHEYQKSLASSFRNGEIPGLFAGFPRDYFLSITDNGTRVGDGASNVLDAVDDGLVAFVLPFEPPKRVGDRVVIGFAADNVTSFRERTLNLTKAMEDGKQIHIVDEGRKIQRRDPWVIAGVVFTGILLLISVFNTGKDVAKDSGHSIGGKNNQNQAESSNPNQGTKGGEPSQGQPQKKGFFTKIKEAILHLFE